MNDAVRKQSEDLSATLHTVPDVSSPRPAVVHGDPAPPGKGRSGQDWTMGGFSGSAAMTGPLAGQHQKYCRGRGLQHFQPVSHCIFGPPHCMPIFDPIILTLHRDGLLV